AVRGVNTTSPSLRATPSPPAAIDSTSRIIVDRSAVFGPRSSVFGRRASVIGPQAPPAARLEPRRRALPRPAPPSRSIRAPIAPRPQSAPPRSPPHAPRSPSAPHPAATAAGARATGYQSLQHGTRRPPSRAG